MAVVCHNNFQLGITKKIEVTNINNERSLTKSILGAPDINK